MRKRATCVIQTKNFPLVNDAPDSAPAEWQAKMRLGCDLTSSQMLEACGGANMRRVAKLFTPGVEVEQYKYTAELLTRRGTYIVQKPFGWDSEANQAGEIRVVLDEVVEMEGGEPVHQGEDAFRHVVGEVELTAEVVGGENEDEHEVLRRREVMGMQGRLDEFGRRNEAVSPAEGVKGKLEAFYGWKEARGGHEAIV